MNRRLFIMVFTVSVLAFGILAQEPQQVDSSTPSNVITNVNFTSCGSTAEILELTINPCTQYRDRTLGNGCLLRRGTDVVFTLRFKPTHAVTSVTHEAYGEIVLANVPFRDLVPNACPSIEGGCPLEANQVVNYVNTIHIKPNWPTFRVPVTYYVKDENGQSLVCFRMAAKLA